MTTSPLALSRPRRGRPPVISDEALLGAARAVFLARGIRATTAEVAERAGVSEGTLFHRYKTKDALFGAAMRVDPDDVVRAHEAILPGKAEHERDLRGALVTFGVRFVELGRVVMPVMMMSWSNRDATGEEMVTERRNLRARWMRSVKPIFDAAIARGELANVNSTTLVHMYIGSLRDFCITEIFADPPAVKTGKAGSASASQRFVEELVTLVLRSAAP